MFSSRRIRIFSAIAIVLAVGLLVAFFTTHRPVSTTVSVPTWLTDTCGMHVQYSPDQSKVGAGQEVVVVLTDPKGYPEAEPFATLNEATAYYNGLFNTDFDRQGMAIIQQGSCYNWWLGPNSNY